MEGHIDGLATLSRSHLHRCSTDWYRNLSGVSNTRIDELPIT